MRNREKNTAINDALKKLYEAYSDDFLNQWNRCFDPTEQAPPRGINTFGIINPDAYDTENGMLFIAKETRNWDFDLLPWLNAMATTKLPGTRYPKMWYNIGRWAKYIQHPDSDIELLLSEKEEAVEGLSRIAFTNLNKIGGYNISGKSYRKLSENEIVFRILSEEIKIIKPKLIVLCGIKKEILRHVDTDTAHVIEMPHPAARNISNGEMLRKLKSQLK